MKEKKDSQVMESAAFMVVFYTSILVSLGGEH